MIVWYGDAKVHQMLDMMEVQNTTSTRVIFNDPEALAMEDVYFGLTDFVEAIQHKYITFEDYCLSTTWAHRIWHDLDFKRWKLANWATPYIDAIERLSPERRAHFLGE